MGAKITIGMIEGILINPKRGRRVAGMFVSGGGGRVGLQDFHAHGLPHYYYLGTDGPPAEYPRRRR